MKKLIFILAILIISVSTFSQKLQKYKEITISSGGTSTITLTEYNDYLLISGSAVAMPLFHTITISGTASKGMLIPIYCKATASGVGGIIFATTGGGDFDTLLVKDINSQAYITLLYTGSTWQMRVARNFDLYNVVTASNITSDTKGAGINVNSGVFSISTDSTTSGLGFVGVSTAKTLRAKYNDSTIGINSAGQINVKRNSIDTVQLKANSVTLNKLSKMTRGTVRVGGSGSYPTDLNAKTSGQILVGDGSDLKSVAVSGDATLASTGALTIGAGTITVAKQVSSLTNEVVTAWAGFDTFSVSVGDTQFIRIPYACVVTEIYVVVSENIGAVRGELQIYNEGALDMYNKHIVQNSKVGTEFNQVVSANGTLAAGDRIRIYTTTASRTTGRVLITFFLRRT